MSTPVRASVGSGLRISTRHPLLTCACQIIAWLRRPVYPTGRCIDEMRITRALNACHNPRVLADHTIRAALRTSWHLQPDGFSQLSGGTTSATWLVTDGSQRYVAKLVDYSARAQLEAGLTAADHLALHDIDAGMPCRAIDGSLSVPVSGHILAVLHFVLGRPLDRADPVDQQWWGDRLGAVHRRLASFSHPGLPTWHWLRPDAVHLDPSLQLQIARAIRALEKLQITDRLTFGTLHGDPRDTSFLLNPVTGRIGVVGWGAAAGGPLMYDVAAAVAYAGGAARAAEFLQAYVASGAVSLSEVESALPVLLRFRWAVQADSLARAEFLRWRSTTGST
jgi:Ser/Thr protein kinase RdoA (MazF antagonist)